MVPGLGQFADSLGCSRNPLLMSPRFRGYAELHCFFPDCCMAAIIAGDLLKTQK